MNRLKRLPTNGLKSKSILTSNVEVLTQIEDLSGDELMPDCLAPGLVISVEKLGFSWNPTENHWWRLAGDEIQNL